MRRNGGLERWYDATGNSVHRLTRGSVPPEEMVHQLFEEEVRSKWLLRGVGWGGLFFGLQLLFSTLSHALARLPLGLGPFLASLSDSLGTLVALGTSASLASTIIAVAWLRFSPILFTALLAAAAALSALLRNRSPARGA
jgi:hypothetical protein